MFALALTGVGLAAGFLLKDQCVGVLLPTRGYDGSQYRRLCYSDIYVLYFARNLAREPIPYIHGDGVLDNEPDPEGTGLTEIGDLEYPAGSGLLVAAAAELVRPDLSQGPEERAAAIARAAEAFFVMTAVLLTVCALAAAWLLGLLAADRRRLAYFALAPSFVLYAFHNWDLAAVALACGALYAFARRADAAAGALAGLGAAAKVFPAVLVAAFALARWSEDRARATKIVVWSIAGFAAVNLPFAIVNPKGWWFPWDFQSSRFPNYDSTWFMLHRRFFDGGLFDVGFHGWARTSTIASGLLFVCGAAALLVLERRRGTIRPYVLSFGLVVLFLLTGKIFSPQYALWLLPFFVLLNVPWYGFAAFAVTEAAVWFTIAGFLLGTGDGQFRLTLTEIAVWARFGALAWLLWWSRRARELVAAPVP